MTKVKSFLLLAIFGLIANIAQAEGDAAKGEKDFRKCKSCHAIASADEVIVKGGKTGPNLYGILGRTAGTVEGFRYSKDLIAAGENGLIWDAEQIAAFAQDPKKFLSEFLDKSAKPKMTFKMKEPLDVIAYLATFSPMDDDAEEDADATASEESSGS